VLSSISLVSIFLFDVTFESLSINMPMTNDAGSKQSPLFPNTRWSLVLRANGPHAMAGQVALGELLKSYWQPLYVFARRSGLGTEDAQDAVQGFCASLIHLESLRTANPAMGKLRSFLLGAFQNHLLMVHRDAQRQKRGGGALVLSLDDAEAALDMQPVDGETPDRAFDRRWAYTLLDHALQKLRGEFAERGRLEVFETLEPALAWNGAEVSYEDLAQKLGMMTATVGQTVKRMRKRFRLLLEQQITDTVDGPEALAEERDHLIRVLSGG
jgi:RNA polymerase sigma factor (sigma-70 family)